LKIGAFLSLGEGNATSDFVKGIVGSATVWPPATQISYRSVPHDVRGLGDDYRVA
jgi:hypothetical protein